MKHHVLCLVDTDDVAQEVIQSVTSAGSGKEDVFLLTVDRPDSEGSDHKEESQLPPRRGGGLSAGIGPAVVGGASHFMSTDGIMDVPHIRYSKITNNPAASECLDGRNSPSLGHCQAGSQTSCPRTSGALTQYEHPRGRLISFN
jgi:hypothetical protein